MDLSIAVQKHAEWKTKLRSAIMKQEQLDVASISKDNCCELGKWLHGEGKAQFGQFESFGECIKKHADFHLEAGKVANFINEKKYPEAEALLEPGSPYSSASNVVGLAIMRLKKETSK
jgi:methyl-accepting chemotaxis protein